MSRRIMTVLGLKECLEEFDCNARVFISGPVLCTPTSLLSYRGYYSDLAIGFEYDKSSTMRARKLADMLSKLVGSTLTGYKGGVTTVDNNTRVWVSNYGKVSQLALVDVKKSMIGDALLITEYKG